MHSHNRLVGGRYRLTTVLGHGGMGQVWRAWDERLERPTAVKEVRFPTDLTGRDRDALRERTLREARVTAQLDHPAIVTTYDVVSEDGQPFIVMELVPSRSLAEEVQDHGPLPAEAVARVGLTVLQALTEAHRQGIVHRDVKPSNVLLADDGRVLLGDFGIATRDTDPGLTATGMLIGSPTYMSPERLRGRRSETATDIWSLGATLYTALVGRPPFQVDSTMGTITAIVSDEPAVPDHQGPLTTALLGMLAKDPSRRLTGEQVRPLLAEEYTGPLAGAPPSFAPVLHEGYADDTADSGDTGDIGDTGDLGDLPAPAAGDRQAAAPAGRSRRRTGVVLAGAVVAAAMAAGISGLLDSTGSTPTADESGRASGAAEPAAPERSSSSASTGTSERHAASRDTTKPGRSTKSRSGQGGAIAPAGFRTQRDPKGFQVAVPRGWHRRLDGPTRVDFVAPDGSRFVRIDQRAHALPSAEGAWRAAEPAVSDQLDGYRRIRIQSVPDPRWDVADWEFTWQGGSGTVHVLDRGIATRTKGWAVYVSTPDATWSRKGRPLFNTVSRTFRPLS